MAWADYLQNLEQVGQLWKPQAVVPLLASGVKQAVRLVWLQIGRHHFRLALRPSHGCSRQYSEDGPGRGLVERPRQMRHEVRPLLSRRRVGNQIQQQACIARITLVGPSGCLHACENFHNNAG